MRTKMKTKMKTKMRTRVLCGLLTIVFGISLVAPVSRASAATALKTAAAENEGKLRIASENTSAAAANKEVDKVKHGEVAFDSITYERADYAAMEKSLSYIQKKLDEGATAKTILAAYDRMDDKLYQAATAINYMTIMSYLDTTNADYAKELNFVTQAYSSLQNKAMTLTRNILNSRIAKEVKAAWGEEELRAIERAERLLDEATIELGVKEQQLNAQYTMATSMTTVEYQGKQLTLSDILAGTDLSPAEQNSLYALYLSTLNQTTGEIYLELVEVRKEIAKILGFDTYTDYCYYSYNRDFQKKQTISLRYSAKTYLKPVFQKLLASLTMEDITNVTTAGGDIMSLEPVFREFFKEVSPDLTEAFDYMLKYKLYNFDASPVKANMSYTTLLYSYHQPYMNLYPSGSYTDISTFVHEFGHYNAFFKHDVELDSKIDIMEIHSQGLEMLFAPYFAAYGAAASSIVKYNFIIYLQILLQGCMEDEFQQYIYSHDVASVKELNELYYRLGLEYGLYAPNEAKENPAWVMITHTFVSPLYYISYATSLVAALQIFEISVENREQAIDSYNKLVDMGTEMGFLATLRKSGLGNPFVPATIQEISEEILEYFQLDDKTKMLEPAA